MVTINNKSERIDGSKCLGRPLLSTTLLYTVNEIQMSGPGGGGGGEGGGSPRI